MTKGKPWDIEDEKKLKDWVEMGVSLDSIVFSFEGKYSKNAIYQKMLDLGLKEEEGRVQGASSSFNLKLSLPAELPSVETALKTLSAALTALETPGLEQNEVLRLRSIISGVKIYKELFADYVDYRGLEAELLESNRKYAEIIKKSQNTKSNRLFSERARHFENECAS